MSVWYAKIVVLLTGLMHAGFGLAYLLAPVRMGALTRLDLIHPVARTEIRAFYGGLELGMAALLILCVVRGGWMQVGLWAVLLFSGCTALGRAFGLIVDGSTDGLLVRVLVVEIAIAVAAAFGLVLIRK